MYFQIHSRKSPDGGRKHSNKAEKKNESLETIQLFFFPNLFSNMKVKKHNQGCMHREHGDAELARQNVPLRQLTKLQSLPPLRGVRTGNSGTTKIKREIISQNEESSLMVRFRLSPTQGLHSSKGMCTTSHTSQQHQ